MTWDTSKSAQEENLPSSNLHAFRKKKHPEKLNGTLLKLYLPYRADSQLKSESFHTYQEFFTSACVKLPGTDLLRSVFDIVMLNKRVNEKHNKVVEKGIEAFEQNGPSEDAWATLASTSELVRLESAMERQAVDPDEHDDVPEYSKDSTERATERATTMAVMEGPQISP